MPNPSTQTEISRKGKQAAGYADTQINNVTFNCMNWNLYHGQIWLSVNYFDGQWSEGIMPRVAFRSSKAVEFIEPACLKPVILHWRQIFFLYPRGHLAMTREVFSCHNWTLPLETSAQARDAPQHSATHRNPLFSAK